MVVFVPWSCSLMCSLASRSPMTDLPDGQERGLGKPPIQYETLHSPLKKVEKNDEYHLHVPRFFEGTPLLLLFVELGSDGVIAQYGRPVDSPGRSWSTLQATRRPHRTSLSPYRRDHGPVRQLSLSTTQTTSVPGRKSCQVELLARATSLRRTHYGGQCVFFQPPKHA